MRDIMSVDFERERGRHEDIVQGTSVFLIQSAGLSGSKRS